MTSRANTSHSLLLLDREHGKADFTNFENSQEMNENSYNDIVFAVMIRKINYINEKQFWWLVALSGKTLIYTQMYINYVSTTLLVIEQFVPGDIWSLPLSGRQTVLTLSPGTIGFASFNNATSFFAVVQPKSLWGITCVTVIVSWTEVGEPSL